MFPLIHIPNLFLSREVWDGARGREREREGVREWERLRERKREGVRERER